MIIDNPYLARKRDVIRAIDGLKSPKDLPKVLELQAELKVLEGKERALIQGIIDGLTDKIEQVQQRVETVKETFKTKRQQYQEVVELKRIVQGQVLDGKLVRRGILHDLRDLAKEMR